MLRKNEFGYHAEPDIDPTIWAKGQGYVLHDLEDCEGDVIWSLTGPDLDLFTYSWFHVTRLLAARGVMVRHTRKTPRPMEIVESGEEEPTTPEGP
jgi:hypothetical protein